MKSSKEPPPRLETEKSKKPAEKEERQVAKILSLAGVPPRPPLKLIERIKCAIKTAKDLAVSTL